MTAIKLFIVAAFAWAAYALGHQLSTGVPGLTRLTVNPLGSSGNNNANVTSTQTVSNATGNWAGYALSGSNITNVRGSWTVPTPSADGGLGADATWIGIGGNSSQDLIQTGTQNSVDQNGTTQTAAFYEMLPDSETTIDSMNVNPGDQMDASITGGSSGEWTIDLTDTTTGQNFSRQVSYDSSLSSAEWIEEDPSVSDNAQMPLDSFGSVTFTGATAVEQGQTVGLAGAKSLTIVNRSDAALTTTSAADGSGFTVTRTAASSQSGIGGYWRGGGGFRHGGMGGSGYSGRGSRGFER